MMNRRIMARFVLTVPLLLTTLIIGACGTDQASPSPVVGASPNSQVKVAKASLSTATQEATPMASVAITLSPAAVQVKQGEVFTVEVQFIAGAQKLDAAQASLNFDPNYLQVVDAAGAPASAIDPGKALPTLLQNNADNTKGSIDYAAGASFEAGKEPSGNFALATAPFKAIRAGQTSITFALAPPHKTEAAYGGKVVPITSPSTATITIAQ